MSLVVVGTVAFDAIETPFGKTDKILGGAATFIGLAAGKLEVKTKIVQWSAVTFRRSTSICLIARELIRQASK